MENNSEVAQLLEQIRLSYEAAKRGMEGAAITARHDFISKRMEDIQAVHQQLQTMIGENEATRLVAETLENS